MQCPVHRSRPVPPLLSQLGAPHVAYIVASIWTLTTLVISAWLVHKHLQWYSCRPQQRHIVRLLCMVPIYASITLASYVSNTTWLFLVRDTYESVAIASLFSLLLEYVAGPRHPPTGNKKRNRSEERRLDSGSVRTPVELGVEQINAPLNEDERATVVHKVFYRVPMYPNPTNPHKPLKWIFPLGFIRARPKDGLSYLHWMKWGVFQYCIIRPGSTLAAVILDQLGLYCEPSWSWRWGHVYVMTVVSVSVTVAMYCSIQLYTTVRHELKPYNPLTQVLTIHSIVFLTFWQSELISGLASLNLVPDTKYLTADDLILGFTALLETFEMMCFACVCLKVFSYGPFKRVVWARAGVLVMERRILNLDGPWSSRSPYLSLGRSRSPDLPRLSQPPYLPSPSQPTDLPPPSQPTNLSPPSQADLPRLSQPASQQHSLPASPKHQVVNLIHAFTFTNTWRDLRAGVLYLFGRGATREADDVCRREEMFKDGFGGGRERSFVRTGGYKGLPQDDDTYTRTREIPGLRYSPLPTPPHEEYDDVATSLLHRQSDEYVPRVEYAPPARPPRGAYVPAHGPAWSGDGIITPPRTPVFGGPGGLLAEPPTTGVSPTTGVVSEPNVQPSQATLTGSRRIGDVYVGGTRGGEFVSRMGAHDSRSGTQPQGTFPLGLGASPISPRSPVSPRSGGTPISARPAGTPVSTRSAGTPVSARSAGGYASPLSAGPYASPRSESHTSPRPEDAHPGTPILPRPKGSPRSPGTHISPNSAHVLAQTSPLFQQTFSADVQAGYPLSPVSPPLMREEAPPRASGETQRTQRNSGFTLPHWASATPTHSQWPSYTPTHSQWPSGVTSSRRTSANTLPPSPTRGRRMSMSEEVEPPSSSRDDSLLVRVFSGATSRTRDSESGGARTSTISGGVSSSNGSDVGTYEGASVQPVRSVSFRSGAPVLVRLGERRDSISSPSLVSSSFGDRKSSDLSTPSSGSGPSSSTFPYTTLPSPPEVARPLRRMSANLQLRVPQGPRAQPRTAVRPAPLSPARYPHSQWRATITRSSGIGHVSSVHGTVSHWNPLRPPSTSSFEGLGRGAGRPVALVPEYAAMSSLSSLSNSDDRYPTVSRRDS